MRVDIIGHNQVRDLVASVLMAFRHDIIDAGPVEGLLMRASKENAEYIHFGMIQFGGDRLLCCDEFIVLVSRDEKPVAVASISPNGEENRGRHEIVGFYVMPEYRWNQETDYHLLLAQAVMMRCKERELVPVHHYALSKLVVGGFNKLPEDLRELVDLDTSIADAEWEPNPQGIGYDYDTQPGA